MVFSILHTCFTLLENQAGVYCITRFQTLNLIGKHFPFCVNSKIIHKKHFFYRQKVAIANKKTVILHAKQRIYARRKRVDYKI